MIQQALALLAATALGTSLAAMPLSTSLASSGAVASSSVQDVELLRYVKVGPQGAKVRNYSDSKGLVLTELEPGQVLAVYGESGPGGNEWLSVEVPGGFPVWVYGKFLRETSERDVYEVTGNNVLQRPRPASDPSSYPVREKLFVRDRVVGIQRNDPSKPLDQDWVQIWSPAGVRAWVDTESITELENGSSGTQLWAQSVLTVREERGTQGGRAPLGAGSAAPVAGGAGASLASSPQEPGASSSGSARGAGDAAAATEAGAPILDEYQASRALAGADERFAAQNQSAQPDYVVVRASYEAILAMVPEGATAELVRSRLREVDARERAEVIRAELALEANAQRNEIETRRRTIEELGTLRDPLENRYPRRGWLEKIERKNDEPIWILRWSGQIVAEVSCSSGRYDLPVFEDYELGITGRFIQTAATIGASVPPHVAVIDISRIEVLSGRGLAR